MWIAELQNEKESIYLSMPSMPSSLQGEGHVIHTIYHTEIHECHSCCCRGSRDFVQSLEPWLVRLAWRSLSRLQSFVVGACLNGVTGKLSADGKLRVITYSVSFVNMTR